MPTDPWFIRNYELKKKETKTNTSNSSYKLWQLWTKSVTGVFLYHKLQQIKQNNKQTQQKTTIYSFDQPLA